MNIFRHSYHAPAGGEDEADGSGNEESLRDALESAFDAGSEQEGQEPQTQSQTKPASTEGAEGHAPDDSADRGDGRTRTGQFARQKTDGTEPQQQADTQQQPQQQQQRDPYARAPQSWKPGAREAWASLPPNVREEIHRRERDSARALSEYGNVRQVHDRIAQLSQQYAPALQAEGVDVLAAAENLMSLASRLRFGTPVEKAHLAAQIIRNYGVDVMALDAVLANVQPPQQAQQPMMDPRVDQLMAQLNAAQQAQQQRLVQTTTEEVESFGEKLEFFEDVRGDMADLMEMAAKRGIDMSLQQAYERACSMSPEINRVLAARAQAKAAGTAKQSTQRAKHAASSVRGTPATTSTPPADDLRGAIEAAIEQVSGR